MSLQRGVMTVGQFSVNLRDETPVSLTDKLALGSSGFATVVFTPAPVGAVTTASNLLAVSCYTGILRKVDGRTKLSGAHATAWLTDEDGKGDLQEAGVFGIAAPFPNWVSGLKPISLTSGTVTDPGGTLTWNYSWANEQNWNPRDALTAVCDHFTAVSGSASDPVEWEVTNDLKLNAGAVSDIYGASNRAIFTPFADGRENNDFLGVKATLTLNEDVEDYANRILIKDSAGTLDDFPDGAFGGGLYHNGQGGTLRMTRRISDTEDGWDSLAFVAQGQYNRDHRVRQVLDISADAYCLLSDVRVGSWTYAYDPENRIDGVSQQGAFAILNERKYRGQTIFPARLRLMEIDQPVQKGMGVYVYHKSGTSETILDLTSWVEYEEGDTRVTVGELRPSIRRAMRLTGVRNG